MTTARPAPGAQVVFQWRKWDGSPHWRHECVYLGADRWGDWLGQPAGWGSERPGRVMTAPVSNVTLVPPSADFALTVNRNHPKAMRIYIDLGLEVHFGAADGSADSRLVTGIDMDLDVVRVEGARGTWIDDEDEWQEHGAQFGYPVDVQRHLESLAANLERQVRAQEPPFDDASADGWLDTLDALGLPPRG